jgi:phosphatidylserine decarboxylase
MCEIPIAKEGLREILLSTVILGIGASASAYWFWPGAIPFVVLWVWVVSFFRDPRRQRAFEASHLCAPADGTVTEVTPLGGYEPLGGPAIRIGIFLSLFNVHVNRAPCSGRVRSLAYRAGEYLDARHPESGHRNESNTLLLDPDPPMPGPVEVRQVAGLLARRIVCLAKANEHMPIGTRFGMIKFGSRTELIIPRVAGTEICVKVGDPVRAGITVIARQPVAAGVPVPEPQPTAYAGSTCIESPRAEAETRGSLTGLRT